MNRTNRGLALPMTIVMLILLGIMATSFVVITRSNAAVTDVHMDQNKYQGLLQAALDRTVFKLKRPDSPGDAHTWGDIPDTTVTYTIDGTVVNVRLQDLPQ